MRNYLYFILSFTLVILSCCNENHKLGYESENNASVEPASQESSQPDEMRSEISNQKSTLPQKYTSKSFSINYPSDWEIVQQNVKATKNTTIAVQIMQKVLNENYFRPNVNVIISNRKDKERTSTLAYVSYKQVNDVGFADRLEGIYPCSIGGCDGSVVEYIANVDDYKLHVYQYIVKKTDNTVITITMTLDYKKGIEQIAVAQEIINSIKIF